MNPTHADIPLLAVTLFVTHVAHATPCLLTLGEAGQALLPGGVTRLDELPDQAARRLLFELTGHKAHALVASLGAQHEGAVGGDAYVNQDALLQLSPETYSTVVRGIPLRRGMQVRILEQDGRFSRVSHEEVVLHEGERPVLGRRSGWLPSLALSHRLDRHFYHFSTAEPTLLASDAGGDGPRWEPLTLDLALAPPYSAWLQHFYHTLRTA